MSNVELYRLLAISISYFLVAHSSTLTEMIPFESNKMLLSKQPLYIQTSHFKFDINIIVMFVDTHIRNK